MEGHPRHAGPGEARPGVPGASGVHPEGDREPQRRWGACWMRLGGGAAQGQLVCGVPADQLTGVRSVCLHREAAGTHRLTPNSDAFRFSSCCQGVNRGASGDPADL